MAVCYSVKKLREQFVDIALDDSEVTVHAHISELCDDCAEVSYCGIVNIGMICVDATWWFC